MIEATRLARLAPGEWRLWIDRSAERLRIPRKRHATQRLQPDAKNLRFDVSRSASNANKNATRNEAISGPNTNARKKRKHSRA